MTGWQRFFLLIVCCAATVILWPQYDKAGLTFLAMFFLLWTCMIVLFSILINLFAIYKIELVHRILSMVFLIAMVACILAYFPLIGGQTPLIRLQQNQWPTPEDVQKGIKRLTFNFDFVRRNVHQDANYVNQQLEDASEKTENIQHTLKKKKEALEELFVEVEDNK